MTAPRDTQEERETDDFGAFGSAPTAPPAVETMPGACPSCKGTEGRLIVHQGQKYWQCMTPKGVDDPRPCKFWSTKMRADDR